MSLFLMSLLLMSLLLFYHFCLLVVGRFQEQQAQNNLSITGFVDVIQIYNPHGLPQAFQFTCLDITPDGTGLFVGGTSGLFYVELATRKYSYIRTGTVVSASF